MHHGALLTNLATRFPVLAVQNQGARFTAVLALLGCNFVSGLRGVLSSLVADLCVQMLALNKALLWACS